MGRGDARNGHLDPGYRPHGCCCDAHVMSVFEERQSASGVRYVIDSSLIYSVSL